MDKITCDALVIGSGISGLSYALQLSQKDTHLKIIIITKSNEDETNTKYAQGGIAVVMDFDRDSFEKHIQDTLLAGDGLCDPHIVEIVVKEGQQRFQELVQWGTQFDKIDDGHYDLHMEGGHTAKRVAHHKDMTGKEMERALLAYLKNHQNVTILNYHHIIDLITEHHLKLPQESSRKDIHCYGAYVLDIQNQKIKTIVSSVTLLATGGIGQVYQNTTNPAIATGDGIGIAYRAKATVRNMAYVQFHPTAFYGQQKERLFLVSEAVRGEGAQLTTISGEPFMQKYDPRGALASRDIVARAIDNEMKIRGDDYVLLNIPSTKKKEFPQKFPNIYQNALACGIHIDREGIPVVPAAHYLCGGIATDAWGQTNIEYLFAVGECARTGLHGANRLASNSLLEALVFSQRAAQASHEIIKKYTIEKTIEFSIPNWNQEGTVPAEETVLITFLKKELKAVMSHLVGIVRSRERLVLAENFIDTIYNHTVDFYEKFTLTPELLELRNMVNTAHLIVKDSQVIQENKGTFFNKDLD